VPEWAFVFFLKEVFYLGQWLSGLCRIEVLLDGLELDVGLALVNVTVCFVVGVVLLRFLHLLFNFFCNILFNKILLMFPQIKLGMQ